MSWHCVEERTSDPIGRIVRKMIFTDIYENEHYAKGKIAIPKEIQLEVRPVLMLFKCIKDYIALCLGRQKSRLL